MNLSKSKSKSKPHGANNNKSGNKSRKISQKKISGYSPSTKNSKRAINSGKDNHGNIKTHRDLTSPKTIEYSKSNFFIISP
jgi:hypothetical protein